MTPTIQELPISKIRRDSGAQFRVKGINPLHAENLREALERGETLPPIIVFFDSKTYWMGDGDHRIEAHLLQRLTTISAEVRQGTQLDARRFGRGANAAHGKPRDIATKRAQVLDALQDPDWKGYSFNAIARECKVSQPFVKQVAVDNGLSARFQQPEDESYLQTFEDSGTRKVERNGTVYEMNTTNLGRRASAPTPQTAAPDTTPEPPTTPPISAPSSPPQEDTRDLSAYPTDFYDDYDTSGYIPEYESDDTTPPAPLSHVTNAPQQAAPTAPTAPATSAAPAAPTGGTLHDAKREEAEKARRELEAMIEALPLAQALSLYGHNGHLFKEQARLWYENQPLLQMARRAASQVRHTTGPVSEAVRQLARVAKADPSEWEGCASCKGSTRVGERADLCELCKGGFTIYQGQGVSAEVIAARVRARQTEE